MQHTRILKGAVSLIAICVLANCSSSSNSSNSSGDPNPSTNNDPTTQPTTIYSLGDTTNATSDISGYEIAKNKTTGNYSQSSITGTFTNESKTAAFGTRTPTIASSEFDEGYDYVVMYTDEYNSGSASLEVKYGVLGVLSPKSDIPDGDNPGTATWNGSSKVYLATKNEDNGNIETEYNMTSNSTSIVADFKSGQVDVDMKNFTVTNITGNDVAVPFDQIILDNLSVRQNEFFDDNGGFMQFRKDGKTADPLGINDTGSAEGGFFGPVVGNRPEEVGGVFEGSGREGIVAGSFKGR